MFVERQTLGAGRARRRRGGGRRAGRPAALAAVAPSPLSRRGAAAAKESWHGLAVHRPRFRVWPGSARRGRRADGSRAAAAAPRDPRRASPFDVIDAEFFWPDGPAAMHLAEALGVPFSIKARGSDIHLWGGRPAVAAQMVEAGRQGGRPARGQRARCKADMAALGHAGGQDPGPSYRRRPRPVPARSTAPPPRRRSASTGRCSSPPAR